jgi:DNA-binding IclR family transcriptional regulator
MAGVTMAKPRTRDGRYTIAVLGKAMDLLDALDDDGAPTLTELSERTAIHKATALRILANLEERGYVERDGQGRYSLGVRLLQLGVRISTGRDLRTVARPVLQALHDEFDETINLAVPADGGLVYIDILQSAQGLRMTASVGMRDDYHSAALGKAIIAQWPLAAVERALPPDPLPRKTPRTLLTRDALFAELDKAREQGFAIDDEENETGARCVAAPLFDHRGQCVGAISIAGPASRLTPDCLAPLGERIRSAAEGISARLGYVSETEDGRRRTEDGITAGDGVGGERDACL